MKRLSTALLALWASLPLSGCATELELGQTADYLDNNYGDWRSTYLEGVTKIQSGQTFYGTLRNTERYSLNDRELLAGFYQPLSERWTVLTEANYSPSHQVLPYWSAMLQVQAVFGQGWGIDLGTRHTIYENDGVTNINQANLTLERYFGNYRAAYSFYTNWISSGGRPASQSLQLSYYYGERSSIGITIASGQEVINLPPAEPAYFNVRSIVATGRYWFTSKWALSYSIGVTEEGNLYTRRGVQLGIRRLL